MTKIYTRTGDAGQTGLLGAGRVAKDNPRIEAYGTVDELNAALGVVRARPLPAEADLALARVQAELFEVGSALADPQPDGPFHRSVGPAHAEALEREIDRFESDLEPLTRFILPGGAESAALTHLARTVCRRAERRVIALRDQAGGAVADAVVVYLNRLSDWLFVLARWLNRQAGIADVAWERP